MGPASPGTIVLADKTTEITATSDGALVKLHLELENLQRVHSVVTPQITPLVSETGTTWFPASETASAFRILPPGAVESIEIGLEVPAHLPPGTYRGALVLLGFREGALPVRVTIPDSNRQEAPATPSRATSRAAARRPRRRKSR
jgi:hypothetical protein